MALLQLTDISHAPRGEHVSAWYLDAPAAGTSLDRTTFELSGWVIGRHSPAREVRLVEDNVLLRRIPLLVSRPDVIAVHPEAPKQSGFWSLVGTVGRLVHVDGRPRRRRARASVGECARSTG